jgi:hypothetical protein
VHEDRANPEGPSAESGLLEKCHHWHDGVIPTEVVVEPEFVDEDFPVLLEELNSFATCTCEPCRPGQRSEVVDGKNDGVSRRRLLHVYIMTSCTRDRGSRDSPDYSCELSTENGTHRRHRGYAACDRLKSLADHAFGAVAHPGPTRGRCRRHDYAYDGLLLAGTAHAVAADIRAAARQADGETGGSSTSS